MKYLKFKHLCLFIASMSGIMTITSILLHFKHANIFATALLLTIGCFATFMYLTMYFEALRQEKLDKAVMDYMLWEAEVEVLQELELDNYCKN